MKVDATLLSEQQLTALNVAKDHLYVQLNANDIQAIEQAVQALKVYSDEFAALRMNRHIDHALKGTKLNDWSDSN